MRVARILRSSFNSSRSLSHRHILPQNTNSHRRTLVSSSTLFKDSTKKKPPIEIIAEEEEEELEDKKIKEEKQETTVDSEPNEEHDALKQGHGFIETDPNKQNDILESSLNFERGPPKYFPYAPVVAVNKQGVFPDFLKIITIDDDILAKLIKKKVEQRNPYIVVALKRDDENHDEIVQSAEDVYNIGCLCQIVEMKEFTSTLQDVTDQGEKAPQAFKMQLLIHGIRRTEILGGVDVDRPPWNERIQGRVQPDTPTFRAACKDQGSEKNFLIAHIDEHLVESKHNEHEVSLDMHKALCNEIISTIRDIIQMNPIHRDTIASMVKSGQKVTENPVYLADMAAALTNSETSDIQEVMAEYSLNTRLNKSLELLKNELKRYQFQEKIRKDVEDKMKESNRKYFLEQEMKMIKKELGIEKDDKEDFIGKWRKRLEPLTVPKDVEEVIEDEIKKFQTLESHSSEFQVTRNYIDWLTSIRWGVYSDDDLDLSRAKKILDEDHYSMQDVKDRILEFIAVTKLRGSPTGKIICLHGPPGTGKTSIASSIARTLKREYYRFSVGGMSDVNEIKGHRRTYIGSMPGKAIQALKKTKTQNPLILLDEVDKIGSGTHHGDPTAALLELLDPEQNTGFLDHYLDVPVDLSKVLFICTANDVSRIPGPLYDRMEMIEVGGYIHNEKSEIAKRHIIPKSLKDSGLSDSNCSITQLVLDSLINSYCRESGVRNLKKHIEKIHRKAAFKLIMENNDWSEANPPTSTVEVLNENLKDFVGQPIFTKERLYQEPPVGAVCGLAWTSMGGSTLYIETALKELNNQPATPDKPIINGVTFTGSLQKVMEESISIAHTVAKHFSLKNQLTKAHEFLNQSKIHLHAPEGAVKKDGPSAGVTMTTAFLSLAMDKPVRDDVAMTGEISLSGHVLPVGGIKEKILAAKRAGIKTVVMPADNMKDWDDLKEEVREGIDVHFATVYGDVFKIAFDDEN